MAAVPAWPEPFWPSNPGLRRAHVPLKFERQDYCGVIVAPPASVGCRPLVVVCPNYSGLKGFDIRQCEYIARLGYVGLAVDYYGTSLPPEKRVKPAGGKDDPVVKEHYRAAFTGMVSLDHDAGRLRRFLAAWREAGMTHAFVDRNIRPAAIGYCFGGVCVIEMLRGGLDFAGLVSFHGLLQTGYDPSPEAIAGVKRPPLVPCENKYSTATVLCIENGTHDRLVPPESISAFFQEMLASNVDMVFENHCFAPHGFALPPGVGQYTEKVDRRSTQAMLSMFREIFPTVQQNVVAHNAAGTKIPAPGVGSSSACAQGLRKACAVM